MNAKQVATVEPKDLATQSMPVVTEKHDSPSRAVAAGSQQYSSIAEWDAYYAGTGPRPTLPPF